MYWLFLCCLYNMSFCISAAFIDSLFFFLRRKDVKSYFQNKDDNAFTRSRWGRRWPCCRWCCAPGWWPSWSGSRSFHPALVNPNHIITHKDNRSIGAKVLTNKDIELVAPSLPLCAHRILYSTSTNCQSELSYWQIRTESV